MNLKGPMMVNNFRKHLNIYQRKNIKKKYGLMFGNGGQKKNPNETNHWGCELLI
ncbi:hypothetical protein QWY87_03950 [Lutimonas halocynthiae]|uniref:hypothetical protein n=1 Tax=Lutimonas halocynthiae TaxID=1446477 RepID=UPI0025B536EC|nr:hypothetical protein [Lutimonas halocynthiae]MDN3641839.1 hypothetical protein [Lutimonas halocynthiae]